MERKLKHHEKKLLKKVNFLEYKREDSARENTILRRYMVTKREDYTTYEAQSRILGHHLYPSHFWLENIIANTLFDGIRYHKLAGAIQKLAHKLAKLNTNDPFRQTMTEQLLEKLCVSLGQKHLFSIFERCLYCLSSLQSRIGLLILTLFVYPSICPCPV
jgi:U3 small nucleolar ribonucleoprotein protein IMP3